MTRKEFSLKYTTKKSIEDVEKNGVFVFDACSLLNIYKLSLKSKKELFFFLKKMSTKNRLWLSHQFFEEFDNLRLGKISEQYDKYTDVKNKIDNFFSLMTENFKSIDCNHSDLHNFDKKFEPILERTKKEIINELKKRKKKYPDFRISDPIKRKIGKLFKVGDAFSQEKYEELIKKGEDRYKRFVPPGYCDSEKDAKDITKRKKFSDVISWFQIIEYAKKNKKPIILITEDKKEDWWSLCNGKCHGPRRELCFELYKEAKVHFQMYSIKEFLEKYVHVIKKPLYKKENIDYSERVLEIKKKLTDDGLIITSGQHILDESFPKTSKK